jgi:hypothetical protein
MNALRRSFVGIGAIIVIFAVAVGFTKQTETNWRIEHVILFSAHILTAIWAWRFGSKLPKFEQSPQ